MKKHIHLWRIFAATSLVTVLSSIASFAQQAALINGKAEPYTITDAKYEDGLQDKALRVTGSCGYAEVNATANMVQTPSFTLEAVVKLEGTPNESNIIAARRDEQGQDWQFWCGPDGKMYFVAFTNDNTRAGGIASMRNLSTGQWYHVCATIDANSMIKLFINGVLAGGTKLESPINNSSRSAIPLRVAGSGIAGRIFAGLVGDVRFYEGGISDQRLSEVQKMTATWSK